MRSLRILERTHPWLLTEKLVVKPDQLIKRRGKSGLLLLDADWQQVKQWVMERAGKMIQVRAEKHKGYDSGGGVR
jgi:ATP citrate (pro-S)-lyase